MDLLHTGRFDGFRLVSSDSDFGFGLASFVRPWGDALRPVTDGNGEQDQDEQDGTQRMPMRSSSSPTRRPARQAGELPGRGFSTGRRKRNADGWSQSIALIHK